MMKNLIRVLILFLSFLPSFLSGEATFNFDVSRFHWEKQISLVELHYTIPYQLLTYKDENGKLTAPFKLKVDFTNLDNGESLSDTITMKSIIPSYNEANKRNLLAIEQFKLYCKPGNYKIKFNIIDVNTGKKLTKSQIFKVDSLINKLTLSDIELATSVKSDTSNGKFTKNGLEVIPNPSGIYGTGRNMLSFYFEIYNLNNDTIPYEIFYSILDDKGKVINTIGPKKKGKPKNIAVGIDVGAFNLVAYKPGFYTLEVKIQDGDNTATGKVNFRIERRQPIKPAKTPFFTDEEKKYYDRIEYIASKKELAFYKSLSDSGKAEFLKRFWLKRDTNPATPENEGLEEFIKRIKYANEHFSTPFKKGYYTDRGRIYIKYGQPDLRKRRQFEIEYMPYEIWEYFSYGGYCFIFSDLSGDGEYQLIYSSTPKEVTLPNWQKYVPEDVPKMHGI